MATSEEMDALSPMKDFMLTYLMPEKCYDIFFVSLNFLHVPCIKVVLSKTVGFWILLGTVMAPLPQLLKILRVRSVEGLSLPSVLLELYAISGPMVYCINNFPLSAWGERLFMSIQTALIGFLILHYRGNTLKGMLFLLAYSGGMYLTGSPAIPTAVISTMEASSVTAVVAGKVIQARTNYATGHTGQLSSVSVLLVWAGSLALIFPALQDTGKSLNTLVHILSACVSCYLLSQVLRYRSSTTTTMKEKSE